MPICPLKIHRSVVLYFSEKCVLLWKVLCPLEYSCSKAPSPYRVTLSGTCVSVCGSAEHVQCDWIIDLDGCPTVLYAMQLHLRMQRLLRVALSHSRKKQSVVFRYRRKPQSNTALFIHIQLETNECEKDRVLDQVPTCRLARRHKYCALEKYGVYLVFSSCNWSFI